MMVHHAQAVQMAEVDLKPANGSGASGSATLSKTEGGVKVVLDVSGLPERDTMYLVHIHLGTCGEEEGGGTRGHAGHEHGTAKEIEYPLSPVELNKKGERSSTTVVHKVTLESLLSGDPMHVNVHASGSGVPPPVACANLNEAR
jgi:hypothetical protein